MSIARAIVASRVPALAFVAMGLGWGGFAAYVPELRVRLGVNDAQFGFLLLGSGLGLVSAMWIAPRVDRLLGSMSLPVASLMLSLAFLAPASISVPAVFAMGMMLTGLSSGLTDIVMNSRVADLEAQGGRPLMNVNHAMFSFGYAASALMAGAAREADVPPQLYFAVLALLSGSLALGMASPGAVAPVGGDAPARAPLRLMLCAGGIVLIAFMVENAIEVWSALHIERSLGGRAAEGALAAAILGLTMGVGRLGGQGVAERWPDRVVLTGASVLTAAGLLIAALAQTPLVACLGFGLAGLGVSVIAPVALAIAGRAAPPGDRTRVIGRVAVIGFTGFFISPMVMGSLSQAFSLNVALATMALALVLVPVVLRRIG